MFFYNVTQYFKDYCNITSVHGIRYISESNRSTFERIWWIIVFLTSLLICVFIINETYQKWDQNAIIITQANKPVSVYEIPFPAVTICPQSKIRNVETNCSEMEYLYMICRKLALTANCTEQLIREFNDSDEIFSFFDTVKPNYNFPDIYFNGFLRHSSSIITEEGLCYSFNLLDRSNIFTNDVQLYKNFFSVEDKADWSLEQGYDNKATLYTFPFRTLFSGLAYGFHLEALLSNDDMKYVCGRSSGFKVLFHTPDSVPRFDSTFDKNYFELSLNQTVDVVLKPYLTTASESIRKYGIDKRGCYFESERYLKYFKKYTFENCELECLTNYTLTLCGCVQFYMPRESDTNICGSVKYFCSLDAKDLSKKDKMFKKMDESKFQNVTIFEAMRQIQDEITGGNVEFQRCGCLPTCTELKYYKTISKVYTDFEEFVKSDLYSGRYMDNKSHVSVLNILFQRDEFVPFERKELYGPTDFLANFGGLFGLFCGFSVLSFIEILYFFTIRLTCNKIMFGSWIAKN